MSVSLKNRRAVKRILEKLLRASGITNVLTPTSRSLLARVSSFKDSAKICTLESFLRLFKRWKIITSAPAQRSPEKIFRTFRGERRIMRDWLKTDSPQQCGTKRGAVWRLCPDELRLALAQINRSMNVLQNRNEYSPPLHSRRLLPVR